MTNFNNVTDLVFVDISSEAWREYEFENGRHVWIKTPLQLHVSERGSHRLFDADGISHYVPPGWIHLKWKAKDGQPNFVL